LTISSIGRRGQRLCTITTRVQPRFICSRAPALFNIYLVRCAVYLLLIVRRCIFFFYLIEATPTPKIRLHLRRRMPLRKFATNFLVPRAIFVGEMA